MRVLLLICVSFFCLQFCGNSAAHEPPPDFSLIYHKLSLDGRPLLWELCGAFIATEPRGGGIHGHPGIYLFGELGGKGLILRVDPSQTDGMNIIYSTGQEQKGHESHPSHRAHEAPSSSTETDVQQGSVFVIQPRPTAP